MNNVAIVQARLHSTRLPAKVLLPLPSGRVALEEVIFRCKQAKLVHQVVVAIPDTEDCDVLLDYCGSALVVRGPELDVLERYRRAAEFTGADVIVRVTSDCPLLPPDVIDKVITRRAVHSLAWASNTQPPTWPLGFSCEAFTATCLRWHAENSWSQESREHVTWSMREKAAGVSEANELCPYGDYSHIRWTLDTAQDYIEIVRAFKGGRQAMNLLDVLHLART